MTVASLTLASMAAVVTAVGVWKLLRIDPRGYGVAPPRDAHPAEHISAARDQQRASLLHAFLRDQQRATVFVFAGVLFQVVASALALAALLGG